LTGFPPPSGTGPCSGHPAAMGLDSLGGGGRGTRGLPVHAGMAVNGQGHPLGLFMIHGAFRWREEQDSNRWVEGLGRTREPATACANSRVVVVGDRGGGDFRALIEAAHEKGSRGRADLNSAREILDWYRVRWQIERFFHALKQGMRIQDRQLNWSDDLLKCIAFDAITAFRVWDETGSMSRPFRMWRGRKSRCCCCLPDPTT